MASKNSYRWNDGKNCYDIVFSVGYENSRDELLFFQRSTKKNISRLFILSFVISMKLICYFK